MNAIHQQSGSSAVRQKSKQDDALQLNSLGWQFLQLLLPHDDLRSYLNQLVNEWCKFTNADQAMAIVFDARSKARVHAVSGIDAFDRHAAEIAQLQQIAGDVGMSGDIVFFSSNQSPSDVDESLKPLATYARANGFQSASLIPLALPHPQNQQEEGHSAKVIGYIAAFTENNSGDNLRWRPLAQLIFPIIARQIEVLQRTEPSDAAKFYRKLKCLLFGSRANTTRIVALMVIATLCFPVPYKLRCKSTLEPTLRRFVASPIDGRLKTSLVGPGDVVKQSQIVAMLDDSELQVQLESAKAELERERERYRSALQEGKVSESQIAAHETKKLQQDIELYQRQIENLSVKSPISGVVVSGDLEKTEGAPLEIGKTLFELAPIDRMDVEIEIPEYESRFVAEGQIVSFCFDAFPLKKFDGKIMRIYPRAEVRDEETVFIAIVELPNDNLELRPGMKGVASINTGTSTLAWNLFHRPIEHCRSYLGF